MKQKWEIIEEKGHWQIRFNYKVITTKNVIKDKTYYSYVTQFPKELVPFIGSDVLYIYKDVDNKNYITTVKPEGYIYSKTKARVKYGDDKIRVISLNKRLFPFEGEETDRFIQLILHLGVPDPFTDSNARIEICLNK